jgi:hypothetical protein
MLDFLFIIGELGSYLGFFFTIFGFMQGIATRGLFDEFNFYVIS